MSKITKEERILDLRRKEKNLLIEFFNDYCTKEGFDEYEFVESKKTGTAMVLGTKMLDSKVLVVSKVRNCPVNAYSNWRMSKSEVNFINENDCENKFYVIFFTDGVRLFFMNNDLTARSLEKNGDEFIIESDDELDRVFKLSIHEILDEYLKHKSGV